MSKAKELAREVCRYVGNTRQGKYQDAVLALVNHVLSETEAELNHIRPPKGFHCVGWGWHEWLGVNTYIMRFLPIEDAEQQSATDFEEGQG